MNEYEEISLKDLILIILKGWKMILLSIFITLGIAVIVFFTNNSQTLNSSAQNKIIFKSEYTTEFGQYTLPYANADAFIILLKEDAFYELISSKSNISVDKLKTLITFSSLNSTDYSLNVSADDSIDIKLLTEQISENTSDYLNYAISNKALDSFENSHKLRKTNLENSKIDKLMMTTYFEDQLKNTNILINNYTVNPMYSIIASNLIALKASLAEIDFAIVKTDKYLTDIKTYLESYTSLSIYQKSTNKFDEIKIQTKHFKPNYTETSKYNYKTLFPISIILGVMIGIFIVFFKNYWMGNSKKQLIKKEI